MGELEEGRQGGIHQLRWAHTGHGQRPRRWDNVRRDTATQIDPLDLPEFTIRQNGGELQGLIEGGRCAGGFKIVEREIHQCSLTGTRESVIQQSARPRPKGAQPSLHGYGPQHVVGVELERAPPERCLEDMAHMLAGAVLAGLHQ